MKKFKLKVPKYSFDHEGMIIQDKFRSCGHGVNVYAIDICKNNMDVMSKEDILECMFDGHDFTWTYDIEELEPLETIKMTKLDYEMLKFVQKQGARYICRDKGGFLNLYEKEPIMSDDENSWWSDGRCSYLREFTEQLFPFVKWVDKKYYVIEDVLENYEIVED